MPPILANTLLSMESFYSSVDPDLSRPRRLPPKLVAGIRAEVMPLRHSFLCSYFIPPLSSGWHHTDNYNNYVWIQWQHCGIVTVSFFLHNCWDFGWANCSSRDQLGYYSSSSAVFFLSPWLVNNAGHLCGDHSTHQGHGEKRKHKMSLPFRGKRPQGTLARRAPCCRNKLLRSGKILFIQDCFWTHLIIYNLLIFSFWVFFFIFNCIN